MLRKTVPTAPFLLHLHSGLSFGHTGGWTVGAGVLITKVCLAFCKAHQLVERLEWINVRWMQISQARSWFLSWSSSHFSSSAETGAGKGKRPWKLTLPLWWEGPLSLLIFDHWAEALSETEGYWVRVSQKRKRVAETSKHFFLLTHPHLLLPSFLLPSPSRPVSKAVERIRTHGKTEGHMSRDAQGPASDFSSGKPLHSSDHKANLTI